MVCIWLTDLSMAQYSVFGSIVMVGGVIGGLVNGKITDLMGRKGVSCFYFIIINIIFIS